MSDDEEEEEIFNMAPSPPQVYLNPQTTPVKGGVGVGVGVGGAGVGAGVGVVGGRGGKGGGGGGGGGVKTPLKDHEPPKPVPLAETTPKKYTSFMSSLSSTPTKSLSAKSTPIKATNTNTNTNDDTPTKASYSSRLASSLASGASSLVKNTSSLASGAVSTASSTASTATALAQTTASNTYNTVSFKVSSNDSSLNQAEMSAMVDELGMNETRSKERDVIYKLFDKLSAQQETSNPNPQKGGGGGKGVLLDQFVKAMISEQRFSPRMADAAFRSLDKFSLEKGYLYKEEFLLAVLSLKKDKKNCESVSWIKLRRHLFFTYFKNDGSFNEFNEFLEELTLADLEPDYYAIPNKRWKTNFGTVDKPLPSHTEHDMDSIVKELIMVKMQYAWKKSELERLQVENKKMKKIIESQGKG